MGRKGYHYKSILRKVDAFAACRTKVPWLRTFYTVFYYEPRRKERRIAGTLRTLQLLSAGWDPHSISFECIANEWYRQRVYIYMTLTSFITFEWPTCTRVPDIRENIKNLIICHIWNIQSMNPQQIKIEYHVSYMYSQLFWQITFATLE